MITIKINDTLKKLVASIGYVIMQKGMDMDNPYFSEVVYLGVSDNESQYIEITKEEAEKIEKVSEEKRLSTMISDDEGQIEDASFVDIDEVDSSESKG